MTDNTSPEQQAAPAPAAADQPERQAAPAAAPAETAPNDALAEAQKRIAELEAKNTELADQWVRAQAEMQNTRRISIEEVAKARKFAVESFADNLIPVIDSIEAGLAIKDATPEQVREGAQATLRQFNSALERSKVLAVNPEPGAKFDPTRHQAISMVPAEQPANTIVTVLQKGYTIAERVLRPALVTVAAPK